MNEPRYAPGITKRPLLTGRAAFLQLLVGEGVRLSGTIRPGVLRAVTHLGIDDEDIDRALEAIPRALGIAARV